MSFISKLNTVVEHLKSNPAIHVAHYLVLPPDLDAIKEVEEKLGYSLDDSITDFYKECGGIQLLWLYKDNEEFDFKKEHIENEVAYLTSKNQILEFFTVFEGELSLYHTSDVIADEIIPDGVILIPPIKMTFLDQNYNGNSDEYGIDSDSFEQYGIFENVDEIKIRRFDMFDVCVNTVFVLDGKPYPAMLTAYDKYEFDSSAIIYFKEYLTLLLESAGNKKRGHRFLLSGDYGNEPISLENIKSFTTS